MEAHSFVENAISELQRANHDSKHPFRYFCLGTSKKGLVDQRTVVMRKFERYALSLFTDRRSPKVQQLKEEPFCHALFWHPRKKLQIRVITEAKFENAEVDKSQLGQLKDYNTIQAPGEEIENRQLYAIDFDSKNALGIKLMIKDLDVLLLDSEQHLRAKASIENDSLSKAVFVVP